MRIIAFYSLCSSKILRSTDGNITSIFKENVSNYRLWYHSMILEKMWNISSIDRKTKGISR